MARNTLELIVEAKGTDAAANDVKGFNRELGGLGSVARTAAGALAGLAVADMAKDFAVSSASMAAESNRLEAATNKLAQGIGTNSENIVASIKTASGGTISEMEAMRFANNAMLLGIVESEDQFAELTTIATTLGRAMGQDAAQSVSDLTTALGRGSTEILDNLGISLKMNEAYEIYAQTLGKTSKELTEQEKKQAFANAALIKGREAAEALGGVQADQQAQVEATAAAWDDFQVAFGQLLLTVEGGLGLMEKATGAIRKLTEGAKAWSGITDQIEALNEASDSGAGSQVGLATAMLSTAELMDQMGMGMGKNRDIAQQLVDKFVLTEETTESVGRAFENLEKQQEETAGGVETVTEAYNEFSSQLDYIEQRSVEVGEGEKQRMLDQVAAAEAAAEAQAQAAEEAAARAQAAYEEQFSQVSGVAGNVLGLMQEEFQGAEKIFNIEKVDVNKAQIVEGANAVAEVAAFGMTEQMHRVLKENMPGLFKELMSADDAKQAAREMLSDFQFGIGSGLILGEGGREAAKERIKKILLGQAETTELINEITQELIAEGQNAFAVQQAAAQAFGGDFAGQAGGIGANLFAGFGTEEGPEIDTQPLAMAAAESLQETIPTAMEDNNIGVLIVETMANQVREAEDEMEHLADVFASGFEQFLPDRLNTTSQMFLETIATYVAQQIGVTPAR